eukprot:14411307-Heterocapsa_arctica.AAC.1
MQAAFMPLQKLDFVLPVVPSLLGEVLLPTIASLCDHRFRCDWCSFVYEHDIEVQADTVVYVWPEMTFLADDTLGSHRPLVSMVDFIDDFGSAPVEPKPKRPKHEVQAEANLVLQFPWLAAFGLKGPRP